MSLEVILCEAIGCTNSLGYFDIKNGKRFCRTCSTFYKVLRWRCKTCPNIINGSTCRETRKYCDQCKGVKND